MKIITRITLSCEGTQPQSITTCNLILCSSRSRMSSYCVIANVFRCYIIYHNGLLYIFCINSHCKLHPISCKNKYFSLQVDLYTPSQYKVFQKVTDNANAAMLNFCSPGFSDLSVRSFFVSINFYCHHFDNDIIITQACAKLHIS